MRGSLIIYTQQAIRGLKRPINSISFHIKLKDK